MRPTYIFFMIILWANVGFAQSSTKNFIDENYIEVTGTARIEIIPDEIYLKIIINEEDNKAKQTLEEIEESMIRKLQQLEINLDSALKVIDIASNLKQYWLAKDNIFTSKEYLLLVHDATTAGRVFRELETINISNITIQLLEHSKIEYFRKLVKIEAVKAAKAKAEAMSNAIGQSAGRALYIEELNSVNRFQGYMPGVANTIMVRGTSEIYGNRSPGPIIEFGKLELEYKVMARFKLN